MAERDVLEQYIGKVVCINTRQDAHPGIPYIAAVRTYDGQFLELEPCQRVNTNVLGAKDKTAKEVQEGRRRHKRNDSISLNKDVIATIEAIVVKE